MSRANGNVSHSMVPNLDMSNIADNKNPVVAAPVKKPEDPVSTRRAPSPDIVPHIAPDAAPVTGQHFPPAIFKDQPGIASLHRIPRPPEDTHLAATINELQKYFSSTQVEQVFMTMINYLFSEPELPYNPYPLLVRLLREYAERKLSSFIIPREAVFSLISMPAEYTRIDYIYKANGCDYIWGLPAIVQSVNPTIFKTYESLAKAVIPPLQTLQQPDRRYVMQPMVILIGPAAFHGSLYESVPMIQFKIEYHIIGLNADDAAKIFVNSVIKDFNYTEKKTSHILLGVTLPLDPTTPPMKYTPRFWQVDEINTRGEQFWEAINATVKNSKPICAEVVFKIDSELDVYKRGQKIYSYNFTLRATSLKEKEKFTSFAELPESGLFEGVFVSRHHAEAYIGMFTSRPELIDRDKNHPFPPPAPLVKRSVRRQGRVEQQDPDEAGRVRVDGFELNLRQPMTNSPDDKKITLPIISAWQKKVARSHAYLDIFEATHYVLLLVLMEKHKNDQEIFVHIHRLFHSTAAKLHYLMQMNKFIRELIENFEKAETSEIVQTEFQLYRKGLKELLDTAFRECSSDLLTCSRAISGRFEEMTYITQEDITSKTPKQSNLILSPKTVLDLRFINHYCVPIFLQLVEDVLPECPLVIDFIITLNNQFPEEAPATASRVSPQALKFGFEDERILLQDYQFLNVVQAMKFDDSPRSVLKESVLMKYLIDTHIDQVWSNYIQDIALSTTFPANPFPKLITFLRQAGQKMNLFFEDDGVLTKNLYHSSAKLVDPQHYVYQIAGVDAYGYQSALFIIDTAAIFSIAPFIIPLNNVKFGNRRGPYRAAISMAVAGQVPFHGRVDPFLRQVDLVDHIYVKGPSKCAIEGLELFSSIVTEHMLQLHNEETGYVILGIYLGGMNRLWTPREVAERKMTFAAELEKNVQQRKSVFMKLYTKYDWRYILVVKHFRYRYVSYDDKECESFVEEDPMQMYFSIFLSKEKTAFHSQRGGGHRCCDPFSAPSLRQANRYADQMIVRAQRVQDWIQVHRWFLMKDVIKKGDAHLADSWRMLHSVAATINFLNCINKVLQDLVFYLLERRNFEDAGSDVNLIAGSESVGSVDLSLLSSTLAGYYSKLDMTLKQAASMCAGSLPSVMRRKLNHVIHVNQATGLASLRVEAGTIRVLEEIRQSCMGVEHALGYDVHCSCEVAVESLRGILAEAAVERPQAEEPASTQVDIDVPQLTVADKVEEWYQDLYKI